MCVCVCVCVCLCDQKDRFFSVNIDVCGQAKHDGILTHLSQRFRMSYCDHLQSIVHHLLSIVHLSTPLNNFSFEIPGPIFFTHVEPAVKGGLKIYTNGHSPLIKMAAMPIYGKKKIFFFRTKKALRLNLGV